MSFVRGSAVSLVLKVISVKCRPGSPGVGVLVLVVRVEGTGHARRHTKYKGQHRPPHLEGFVCCTPYSFITPSICTAVKNAWRSFDSAQKTRDICDHASWQLGGCGAPPADRGVDPASRCTESADRRADMSHGSFRMSKHTEGILCCIAIDHQSTCHHWPHPERSTATNIKLWRWWPAVCTLRTDRLRR